MKSKVFGGGQYHLWGKIAVFLCLVLVLLRRIDDFDIWYHLSIGKEIATTKAIPAVEFIVFTLAGQSVHLFEWAFGVLHYLTLVVFGYWGMSILNALMGAGALVFAYLAARQRLNNITAPLLALGALLWLMAFRFIYRPEMVLFLSLALGLYALERYERGARARWLVLIPAVSFLNSNFHPSSMMLVILCGAYFAQYLIRPPGDNRSTIIKHFLPLILLTGAAGAIGPYGLEKLFVPFHFSKQTYVLESTLEFTPALKSEYSWRYVLLSLVGCISLAAARKKRVADILLFVFYSYLTYRHFRNLALFALFSYLPVVTAVHDRLLNVGTPVFRLGATAGRVVAAITFGILAASHAFGGPWGAGPAKGLFPEEAAEVILKNGPEGKIFNVYHTGGYLGWVLSGRYGVFVDGRHYSFDKSFYESEQVTKGLGQWRSVLDRYNIHTAVVSTVHMHSGGVESITHLLLMDDEWYLANAEEGYLLFFRRQANVHEGIISKSYGWQQIISDAENILKHYPSRDDAYHAIILAGLKTNDYDKVRYYAREYLKIHPDDQDVKNLLMKL
jgi:hypothetical protein